MWSDCNAFERLLALEHGMPTSPHHRAALKGQSGNFANADFGYGCNLFYGCQEQILGSETVGCHTHRHTHTHQDYAVFFHPLMPTEPTVRTTGVPGEEVGKVRTTRENDCSIENSQFLPRFG